MYRDLAHVHSLPLIPFLLEGVGGQPSLNQTDGIHPTAEGYRIVVENVLQSLLPVLNKPGAAKARTKRRRETSSPLTMSGATFHAEPSGE